MLDPVILRRYAISRSGLAVGAVLLLISSGRLNTIWTMVLLVVAASTLLAAVAARRRRTRVQAVVCGDVLLPMFLAPFTGGAASPFLLLFYMAVIVTGVTMGVPTAIAAAGAVSVALLVSLSVGAHFQGEALPAVVEHALAELQRPDTIVRLCVAVGFLFLIAVLSGYLGVVFRRRGQNLVRVRRELNRTRLDVETVTESLARGLVSLDVDGRVTRVSRAAARLLGLSGEILDRDVTTVLAGELAPLAERFKRTLGGVEPVSDAEARVSSAAGERRVALSTFPVRHGARVVGVVGVIRDITDETKEQERSRRRERLATIGAHSAGIVHELRNLLKPLSGTVELLAEDLQDDPRRQPLVRLIRDECESMETFLDELLKFSGDRPLDVRTFTMGELVKHVADAIAHHPENESVDVSWECDCPVAAEGDRDALERMLFNLTLNCVQAAPGGHVRVCVTSGADHALIFRVTDDGPGVDPGIRDRIFEPFFTTRRGGTGLGLAAVKRTVEQHRGTISLSTPEDGGTQFEVRLPQTGAVAAQSAA